MSGNILELMGATAGALALIDRMVENPKARRRNPRALLQEGDVFVHWIDPTTRRLLTKQVTVVPQGIKLARSKLAAGALDPHVIEFKGGVANVVWDKDDAMKNPRGRSKRPVTRKSQATGKPPTKRLVARRVKTARAPKGFFANPVKGGYDVEANGTKIAQFRTLTHAKEYGHAFANRYKVQVKLRKA